MTRKSIEIDILLFILYKKMTQIKKTLWAILFSIMAFPSCNHWRKIDIDARDSSLQYAFTLVTEEKKHCVIRENNVLSIITGVKDNQAIYQQLDDKSQDTARLLSLIQRILDKGEFTASRPFHSDPFENYLLKQDAPNMHFGLSNSNNSILAGREYTWYYIWWPPILGQQVNPP